MLAALKKHFGWNDGDEIIVSVVGFPTTISVIAQNNLTPVFIDIELNSLNFDTSLIDEKITEKTKAIFVSPVLGNPPDINKLLKYKEQGLHLILDGCDSLGTLWEGKHLNSYFVATSHSFYPAHHISTGEGGMVTSNNAEVIKIARSLAWWGRDCYCVGSANLLTNGTCGNRFDKWLVDYDGIVDHKYIFSNMGYNLKPMDFQGAIGIEQVKKLPDIITKRINNKNKIDKLMSKYVKEVKTVKDESGSNVSWFGAPYICDSKKTKSSLVSLLESNKIQTRNYFAGNILLHPGYKHLGKYTDYPNANKVLDQVFFLGVSPHYTDTIIDYIESVLKKWKI
jgi:CDP-6-deoxy-D-xylo-4-hexulose-3-dehydrase